MKKTIALFTILLTMLGFQCEKNNDATEGKYKGELLDIPNCGAPVIKILEGDLGKINHEATWTHPGTGQVYTNVFVVKNHCYFDAKGYVAGEEFHFNVVDKFDDPVCAICMAIFPTPAKTNLIRISELR